MGNVYRLGWKEECVDDDDDTCEVKPPSGIPKMQDGCACKTLHTPTLIYDRSTVYNFLTIFFSEGLVSLTRNRRKKKTQCLLFNVNNL